MPAWRSNDVGGDRTFGKLTDNARNHDHPQPAERERNRSAREASWRGSGADLDRRIAVAVVAGMCLAGAISATGIGMAAKTPMRARQSDADGTGGISEREHLAGAALAMQ